MQNSVDLENLEARDSWIRFGNLFGWRLLGWTYSNRATFVVDKHETVEITERVRIDIQIALDRANYD